MEPLNRRNLLRGAASRGAVPLRPPGALGEADFLAACTRCGQCVAACPFDTLTLIPKPECKIISTRKPNARAHMRHHANRSIMAF